MIEGISLCHPIVDEYLTRLDGQANHWMQANGFQPLSLDGPNAYTNNSTTGNAVFLNIARDFGLKDIQE